MPRQFDIVENLDPAGQDAHPLLVVLQHDRISSISTIVVAPLIAANRGVERMRLHPSIEIEGKQFLVLIEQIAAIPRPTLGRVVGNAGDDRYRIIGAIDLLFTGI